MSKWLLYLLLCLLPLNASAQRLRAQIEPETAKIGEHLTITLSVNTATTDSLQYEAFQHIIPTQLLKGGQLRDQGPDLEIIKACEVTEKRNKNRLLWKGKYTVCAWDSGTFIIPAHTISINDSVFRFNELIVEVGLSKPQKGVDLYDIREHYSDVPNEPLTFTKLVKKYWWVLVIILCGLLLYKYFKNKYRKEHEQVKEYSLKERTLLAIESLENDKLWEKGRLKEHFTELSYILRSYLTARYSISLLERTSYQTKMLLKDQGLADDTLQVINRVLSQSDLVKFAKSHPDDLEILKISALVKQVVVETSPLDTIHVH